MGADREESDAFTIGNHPAPSSGAGERAGEAPAALNSATFAEVALNGDFLLATLSIIVIDVILSADNCVVIALAVQTLPANERRRGIVIGAVAAAAMRIGFTWFTSQLMQMPFVELAGGLLILWIAFKLLVQNEEMRIADKPGESLWHAIRIIMVADFTMSLDNVLGVAGASRGNAYLLWFGLGLSIPLVVFTSSLLLRLLARFPSIVTVGAALLGKVGGAMVVGDPFFRHWFPPSDWIYVSGEAVGVALVLYAAFWVRRRRVRARDGVSHGVGGTCMARLRRRAPWTRSRPRRTDGGDGRALLENY